MSRVQKGGTVFKPAKLKARSTTATPQLSQNVIPVVDGPSSAVYNPIIPHTTAPTPSASQEIFNATPGPSMSSTETTSLAVFETPSTPPSRIFPPIIHASSTINLSKTAHSVMPPIINTLSSRLLSSTQDTPALTSSLPERINTLPTLPNTVTPPRLSIEGFSNTMLQDLLRSTRSTDPLFLEVPLESEEDSSQSLEQASHEPEKPKRTRSRGISKAPSVDAEQDHWDGEDVEEDNPFTKTESKRQYTRGRSKRKSRGIDEDEDASADEDVDETASTGPKRKRRKKIPPPPFDPEADPGEELDPTIVTMATLCYDIGQGRVSSKAAEIVSNHVSWKVKNKERRARMRITAERKKYGLKEDSDDEDNAASQEKAPAPEAIIMPQTETETDGNDFDYSQNLVANRYNVQVRIGPNGETVIDDTSLVVERDEEHNTEDYTHVIESDQTKFTNSGTYGKRFRGSRWSAEETEMFYDALAQYGENYELISYVMPGRDRKACKNKFKAEDKKNPARIDHCLKHSIPVDIRNLERMTGKDFSGPVPEVSAPVPILPPAQLTVVTTTDGTLSSNIVDSSKVRKRSRSRSKPPVAGDGIQIVGDVDTFDPQFAPDP